MKLDVVAWEISDKSRKFNKLHLYNQVILENRSENEISTDDFGCLETDAGWIHRDPPTPENASDTGSSPVRDWPMEFGRLEKGPLGQDRRSGRIGRDEAGADL